MTKTNEKKAEKVKVVEKMVVVEENEEEEEEDDDEDFTAEEGDTGSDPGSEPSDQEEEEEEEEEHEDEEVEPKVSFEWSYWGGRRRSWGGICEKVERGSERQRGAPAGTSGAHMGAAGV